MVKSLQSPDTHLKLSLGEKKDKKKNEIYIT